jgi:hypothetical protein
MLGKDIGKMGKKPIFSDHLLSFQISLLTSQPGRSSWTDACFARYGIFFRTLLKSCDGKNGHVLRRFWQIEG